MSLVPPHAIDAEQAVLGSMLVDPNAWEQLMDHLNEQDFYRNEHRAMYRIMLLLIAKRQPIDPLTVTALAQSMQQLEHIGGETYVFELAANTSVSSHLKAYADIVYERSVLRQLIAAAHRIVDMAYHPQEKPIEDILDEANRCIFDLTVKRHRGIGPQRILIPLQTAYARIEEAHASKNPITGLASGYRQLDYLTSGFHPGELIVIAGRPSMGKTTLAMNIVEYTAMTSNHPVLVFSMEMSSESLAMRVLSSMGHVTLQHLKTGQLEDEDWYRLRAVLGQIGEKALFVDDTPALSPHELRARARRIAYEHHGLSLIAVDYLQLMQTAHTSENRANEVAVISRALKTLAKELNVPVIALSQLNRSLEQRADKHPMLSDLRESGAIEQDADVIVFIYRDEVYHPDTHDKGMAEIIIAKQRNGPTGRFFLNFLGEYTRFENITD
jgi:replicative DNA helicase